MQQGQSFDKELEFDPDMCKEKMDRLTRSAISVNNSELIEGDILTPENAVVSEVVMKIYDFPGKERSRSGFAIISGVTDTGVKLYDGLNSTVEWNRRELELYPYVKLDQDVVDRLIEEGLK